MNLMTIAQAARAAGITPKMARHYESLGLLAPAHRSEAGYRLYGTDDVRIMRVIGRARDLGFGLPSIARLLEASRQRRAEGVGAEIALRIAELEQQQQQLARTLDVLRALPAAEVVSLSSFDRPQCPAAMAGAAGPSRGRRRRTPADTHHPLARNPLFSAWATRVPEPS